jgi:hypothetical protein
MSPRTRVYRDAPDLKSGDIVLWADGNTSKIIDITTTAGDRILVTFEGGSQTWFRRDDRVPVAERQP